MRGELAVRVVREDSRTVVAVSGELDMATAPVLEAWLEDAGGDGLDVALDLHALGFIDASGLRALLRAQAGARDRGHHLAIVCHGPPVERLLAITGTAPQLTAS